MVSSDVPVQLLALIRLLDAKVVSYRWLVRDLTTALENRNREYDALAQRAALTPKEQAYCKSAEADSPDSPIPAAPLLATINRLNALYAKCHG